MSKKEKLLEKALRNPGGLSFHDFQTLLRRCGWSFDHQTGSHQIWYSQRSFRISIQVSSNGKAKGYQVRQFLEQLAKEILDEKI